LCGEGEGGLLIKQGVCGGVGATTIKEYEEIIILILAANLKSNSAVKKNSPCGEYMQHNATKQQNTTETKSFLYVYKLSIN